MLRPWTMSDEDISTCLAASLDPEIRRNSSVGLVRDRADAIAWLTKVRTEPDRMDWAIEVAGSTAGRVGLAHIDDESGYAELGYWLLAPSRGRGMVTAAVLAVTDWAFADGGLGRLEIKHVLTNERSCAVADRCRFPGVGIERGGLLRQGQHLDLHVHARVSRGSFNHPTPSP
jgi:ribosomal-protein-alanine N-acetyltransferase